MRVISTLYVSLLKIRHPTLAYKNDDKIVSYQNLSDCHYRFELSFTISEACLWSRVLLCAPLGLAPAVHSNIRLALQDPSPAGPNVIKLFTAVNYEFL